MELCSTLYYLLDGSHEIHEYTDDNEDSIIVLIIYSLGDGLILQIVFV